MKRNYFKILCSALLISSFLLLAMGSDEEEKSSDGTSKTNCEYPDSVDDVRECIGGTWIADPIGEVWTKIEFTSNNTYTMYQAIPSSGQWSSNPDFQGSYNIEERRYADTGQKYFSVNLSNSGMCSYYIAFDSSGGATLICGENYDTIYKTDKNPWD